MAHAHEIVTVPDVGQPSRVELRQQCYDVRIDVFHHEQKFPLESEIKELDETATHFLLRLVPSLKPVGTILCWYNEEKNYYKLGSLAVLKDYRKYSFGRELVLALLDYVYVKQDLARRGRTTGVIWAHSQIPVKGFYARFGFSPQGDEFDA